MRACVASPARLHPLRLGFGVSLALALSACATAQMHTPEELSAVGRTCGAAEGELIQDAEAKKVLILYAVAPPRAEIHCIAEWARRHHLHLAYIEAVNQQSQ